MNEVRVADDLVDGAHFKHDNVIGAPCETFLDRSFLDQLRPQDVEDGFEDELDEGDPITLFYPLIDSIHASGDKVPLVRRRTPFESARNVVCPGQRCRKE